MIIEAPFRQDWTHKGHRYGTCMSKADVNLMYVNIPKNASSWTKPNLLDWGWEFYNYHSDKLDKLAIVVLRDPVDRWISGIAECLTLYHPSFDLQDHETVELIFDRICFDDHTERQVNFIHGLDTSECIFLKCDKDYRKNFSSLVADYIGPNKYDRYDYQHESRNCPDRTRFKNIFEREIQNPKYLDQVQSYFQEDYKLIDSVDFYVAR